MCDSFLLPHHRTRSLVAAWVARVLVTQSDHYSEWSTTETILLSTILLLTTWKIDSHSTEVR